MHTTAACSAAGQWQEAPRPELSWSGSSQRASTPSWTALPAWWRRHSLAQALLRRGMITGHCCAPGLSWSQAQGLLTCGCLRRKSHKPKAGAKGAAAKGAESEEYENIVDDAAVRALAFAGTLPQPAHLTSALVHCRPVQRRRMAWRISTKHTSVLWSGQLRAAPCWQAR